MARYDFSGIWLPLVTPLRDGRIDFDAACALAEHYRAAGIAGLVLFGSTGEGNLFSQTEKAALVHALSNGAAGLPLMMGAGGVDTHDVAACIRRMERLDLAGYLVAPPYYLGPSQEGILWHYGRIAAETERPVVVYDVPRRTGAALTLETLQALAHMPGIAAVKECQPAMLHSLDVRRTLPVLCGDDESFLDHFLAGGQGAIAASAHIRPDLFVAAMQLAQIGDEATARMLFDPLRPLIRLLFAEPNPAPLKRALSIEGRIADELRLPMTPASDALGRRLRCALERLPERHARRARPVCATL